MCGKISSDFCYFSPKPVFLDSAISYTSLSFYSFTDIVYIASITVWVNSFMKINKYQQFLLSTLLNPIANHLKLTTSPTDRGWECSGSNTALPSECHGMGFTPSQSTISNICKTSGSIFQNMFSLQVWGGRPKAFTCSHLGSLQFRCP